MYAGCVVSRLADDARIANRVPRFGSPGQIGAAAAEFEELGFAALWIPDDGGPVIGRDERNDTCSTSGDS